MKGKEFRTLVTVVMLVIAFVLLAVFTFFIEPEGSFDCKWESFKAAITNARGFTCKGTLYQISNI